MSNYITNRIIKFRGKELVSGKWIYGDYLACHRTGMSYLRREDVGVYDEGFGHNGDIVCVWPNSVQQWVLGLYDGDKLKFALELYEGDIVEYSYEEEHITAEIVYDDFTFKMREHHQSETCLIPVSVISRRLLLIPLEHALKMIKVVGNSFDKILESQNEKK
jgi:hypothetical protein